MTSRGTTLAPSRASSDTIFAPASGIGRAAVAVIRISGLASEAVLRSLTGGPAPPPRRASLRKLVDPDTREQIDEAIVLWMPGPGTFTGEDQAELQIHGSLAVRSALLRVLSLLPNCRAAEPGEFTRRAFLNGRLDLTAVEGLADLIDAETETQRRQALRQLEGGLGRKVEAWRDQLIDALAACEAALDFADEDDVPADVAANAAAAVADVRRDIARALGDARRGERIRDGFQVVIAGPPNAGKSTLLNALARRDVAIVSPIPGTTRDVIEVRCDLGGLPVTFADTAGLRESQDVIERAGIERARQRMERADLVLWLEPPEENPPLPHAEGLAKLASLEARKTVVRPSGPRSHAAPQDEEIEDSSSGPISEVLHLRVATKSDVGPAQRHVDLSVSAKTGAGIDELLAKIGSVAGEAMDTGSDAVLTRERHRAILVQVGACLDRVALVGQGSGEPRIELVAEDIRLALRYLGRMTGAVDVEDILDRIFASFCIGK